MGAGIARLLVDHGFRVRAFDPERVPHSLRAMQARSRLTIEASLAACADDADFVFEAVPEDVDLKSEVLGRISSMTAGVIASNTSTFIPSAFAPSLADPTRFLVAHFFNPPELIPLVEVVPTPITDPSVVSRTMNLLAQLGKVPVQVQRERAGFIANRLQAALLREAIALVQGGVATPAAIDSVVTNGVGPRWAAAGPFQIADLGGLDVWARVCAQIFPSLDDSISTQHALMDLVEQGRLGAKNGTGFYDHTTESTRSTMDAIGRVLAAKADTQ